MNNSRIMEIQQQCFRELMFQVLNSFFWMCSVFFWTQVFNCDVGYCGRFYHPVCVSKWVTSNPSKQKMVVESIQQGVDTFLCPAHKCRACKLLEAVKDVGQQQQFAKCRRCPSSWHVECLPSWVYHWLCSIYTVPWTDQGESAPCRWVRIVQS